MRTLFVFFQLLILSAQLSAEEDPCAAYGMAAATIQCDEPKWKAAEKQLQSTYESAVKLLKEDSPHLVQDLVTAQRTWIKFRAQYCHVYARARVEGNSWTAFWESQCLADEALSRSNALKHMIEGE